MFKKTLIYIVGAALLSLSGCSDEERMRFAGTDEAISVRSESPDKVRYMTMACKVSDEAMRLGMEKAKPGMTELQLQKIIEDHFKTRGYGLSFPTISVAGRGTSYVHGVPGKRKIRTDDIIMVDEGAKYLGKGGPWCCDITRTYFIGSPTSQQLMAFILVKEAQAIALDVVKAGVRGGDVDKAARDFLHKHGYSIPHSVGHGVGRKIHERPNIGPGSRDVLKVGDVITVEPGVYLKRHGFGVRIEDTVVVTKDGYRSLTNTDRM